ncbi:MAG: galE1 [Proteobacteria bacterium]|nr:galE1 [Pseudomonadota bacterium]
MILVSGSSGFIGRRLTSTLRSDALPYRGMVRKPGTNTSAFVTDLADEYALAQACAGVDCVFHCAGYAHAFASRSGDDSAKHREVNFEGTRHLVDVAGRAGVRRFIFLSSVKAMAEPGENCVDEDFPGSPETAYGQSKLAAEQSVLEAGRCYGMHVVNLRLAMVYGSGGRGNLERMGRLVARGLFPPLPETGNHRSLVHVDDVVSAMRLVAADDRANGRTYIVAGREAPSGRALYDALRQMQGLPPCRWSIPAAALRWAAGVGDGLEKMLGRRLPLNSEVLDRLLGSAWYSPNRIERELGWIARVSLLDGLSEMLRK